MLDLACGDSIYTRRFRHAGTLEVTGVDVSEGMIELDPVSRDSAGRGRSETRRTPSAATL
ncbi:MAG: class I SAM-dependent methyltransferase [Gammaproteobacteria bacterium]|nr:class I SAM-dependent methyltransferase [Gammaproteobacteria bacterium]